MNIDPDLIPFSFVVTVHCATYDEATTVLAERLGYDEDYGYRYQLTWNPAHPADAVTGGKAPA